MARHRFAHRLVVRFELRVFHFSSFSKSPFEYGVLHVLIDAAAALAFSFHRCSFTPNTRSQKIVTAELSRPMSAAKRKAREPSGGYRKVSQPKPEIIPRTPRNRGRKVERKIREALRMVEN